MIQGRDRDFSYLKVYTPTLRRLTLHHIQYTWNAYYYVAPHLLTSAERRISLGLSIHAKDLRVLEHRIAVVAHVCV